MSNYNRRNVTKRLERELRSSERAKQEHSKNIAQFPFISGIEIFFYKGSTSDLHKEYVVHFTLTDGMLLTDFEESLKNKLRWILHEEGQ